jgi:predicted transcriptional regulator
LNFKKDRHGYVCATYQKNGNNKCQSHYIDHQLLKETVLGDLNQLANDSLDLEALFQTALRKMGKKVNTGLSELKHVEHEIEKIATEKRELLRMRTRGELDQVTYEDQYQFINKEYQLLLERQIKLEQLLHNEKDTENNLRAFQNEIKQFARLDIGDEEQLRQVLHKLIDKIEVSNDGEITIHYNFKNPLLRGA